MIPEIKVGRAQELKAFEKLELVPEETNTLRLALDKYSVSCYDADNTSWRAAEGTHGANWFFIERY